MMAPQVEYVGFKTKASSREYTLVIKKVGSDPRTFTVAIPSVAFLAHRVRYQDGPEICFLKLQRALATAPGDLPPKHVTVTDADLKAYKDEHSVPEKARRRLKPSAARS